MFDRIDINGDGKCNNNWKWNKILICNRVCLSIIANCSPSTGELSLEEFVAGARNDEEFMEVMMKSLDLSHIVAMIHNRRHSV